jgi:hypothetical protein
MLVRNGRCLLQWLPDSNWSIVDLAARPPDHAIIAVNVCSCGHTPRLKQSKTTCRIDGVPELRELTHRTRSIKVAESGHGWNGTSGERETPAKGRHVPLDQSNEIVLDHGLCKIQEHDLGWQVFHRRSTIPTNIRAASRAKEVDFLADRDYRHGCVPVAGELMSGYLSSVVFDG